MILNGSIEKSDGYMSGFYIPALNLRSCWYTRHPKFKEAIKQAISSIIFLRTQKKCVLKVTLLEKNKIAVMSSRPEILLSCIIVEQRIRKNLTLKQLAQKAKIKSVRFLKRIEKAEVELDFSTFQKLCKALGLQFEIKPA